MNDCLLLYDTDSPAPPKKINNISESKGEQHILWPVD